MATSETDLNRSATGQAAASHSVADACPLSQADEDVLIQGFRRSQQITAAGRMAFVNFLVSAVFASFGLLSIVSSLLNSALSIPAVVITIGLATVAAIELRGKILFGRLSLKAPTLLGCNQIGFMCLLVLYGTWSLYAGFTGPNPMDQMFSQEFESVVSGGTLYLVVIGIMYGALIVLSIIFQGMNAVYYFRRRKPLQAFLDETPQWVIDLIRRMKSDVVRRTSNTRR